MRMNSLLRDMKTCQVCRKSFSNASALRGHMMSHSKNISAPNAAGSASGSTLPSLETSNKAGANFKPQEVGVAKQDLKRGEGAQKTKRKRNMIVDKVDSTGSRSSLTAVEEAALCLVAMSKGQRPANSQNLNAIDRFLATPHGKEEYYETDFDSDDDDKDVKYKSLAELLTSNVETPTYNNEDEDDDDDDEEEEDDDDDDDEDEDDDDDEAYLVARENKFKKKFVCDVCGKVFGSYQALGGHRSRQKCKRLKVCDKNDQDRRYECDFCGRVFESCQALGGHKKAHYI